MLLLLFPLFLSSLFSIDDRECPQIDKDYIIGNYAPCSSSVEGNDSIRCKYIKAMCNIAESSYDKARYDLSLISADVADGKFDEFNGLALTSLAEIAFLQGDYKRGKTLASAVNEVLIKKLPSSYPYAISEVLLAKSYFDSKNIPEANKKIESMKVSKIDTILFSSLDPWK
ncbi:MAG: hypothetical protein WCQ47_06090 [bacterium]